MATNNGVVSSEMRFSRINKHGKIASLSSAFSLTDKAVFSIVIIPKTNITAGVVAQPDNAGIIASVKMYHDETASDYFFKFLEETPASIIEIPATAIDLSKYDVYWGSES